MLEMMVSLMVSLMRQWMRVRNVLRPRSKKTTPRLKLVIRIGLQYKNTLAGGLIKKVASRLKNIYRKNQTLRTHNWHHNFERPYSFPTHEIYKEKPLDLQTIPM